MKTRTSSIERKVVAEATHHDIPSTTHKGLVAYKATSREVVTTVRNGRTHVREGEAKTFQGVCKKSELDGFLSGKLIVLPEHAEVKRGDWHSAVMAVSPGYLEEARRTGFITSHNWDALTSMTIKDPVAALDAGEEVNFIECTPSTNELHDLDGVPYPVAIRFGYIDGRTHSQMYDLKKAVGILSQRDDVTLTPQGAGATPRYITPAPHWSDEGGNHIAFVWHPSREDYVRAVAYAALSYYRDIREAAFDLDLHGLHAGGARLHDDYNYCAELDYEDQ